MNHCSPFKLFTASLFVTAAMIVSGHAARAQEMDYGSLQSLMGEPVTTSATGTPQRVSDVAANMTIITADQIRQAGSRQIPQIIGMYVPGMDILQTGYAGFDVGVRGYQQPSMPRLLVLVDGRQVFVDDYSRTVWNNIPVNIDDIRQIEVVKGPASALFGSNAAGGVVNIVTYSPQFDHKNVASVYAGSESTFGGDATVTRNGEWGGTKFSVGGYNAHEFNSWSGDPVIDQSPLNPSKRYISNRSAFRVSPDLQFNTELTYSFSRENYASATYVEGADRYTAYSLRGGFQWQTPYGLIVNDNYFNRSYDDFLLTPLSGGELPFTTNLAVSKIEDQFSIGAHHTFRIGFEYRNKTYENDSFNNVFAQQPALQENNYAPSATWLWQITDKLSWTNAARFDHMDMTETGTLPPGSYYNYADYGHDINTLSANSGLVYQMTDMDTFRLSYGRGVQQPSMIESGIGENYPIPGSMFEIIGNPKLEPTIVENYELGYDRKLPDIFSTTRFAVFYQQNKDLKSFYSPGVVDFNGTPAVLFSVANVGNSQGWGGEIELKGTKDGFRWDASYSLSRVDDDAQAESLLYYNGSAPEHHFRLLGGYSWRQWEFDANGHYVTSTNMMRANQLTNVPVEQSGYATLGGRIGYNINDTYTLALSGINVNRQYIKESPFPAVERQVLFTLTGKFD
ncbi:MAG TPA: TonB-dependent receptor [Rickettsiales bacterium]|nr:TonB-dependent receptor [Rickettsiales bacterium]